MDLKKIKTEIDESVELCKQVLKYYEEQNEGKKVDPNKFDADQADKYSKGVKKLMNISRSPFSPHFLRARALFELYDIEKDFPNNFAIECLMAIRASIDFSEGDILENQIETLRRIIKSSTFPSEERYKCALDCFNADLIECWCDFFSTLINDPTMMIDHRVECAKFLFFNQQEDSLETALKFLKGVVEDHSLPSEYRYQIIASFISDNGLAVRYNVNRLPIHYDADFVYPLQKLFFFDETNDVRSRLLSGQFLLQAGIKSNPGSTGGISDSGFEGEDSDLEGERNEIKLKVEDAILNIALNAVGKDDDDTHKIRADAADILLRLASNAELKAKAGEIIEKLGGGDDLYSNQENIHNTQIQESTNKYIEKLVVNLSNIPTFDVIHNAITQLINELDLSFAQQIHALKSLNRISIDTAKFTKFHLNMAQIMCYVWKKIDTFEASIQKELKIRLIEEFIDMTDTCSTGHNSRLVNIFCGYDEDVIQISIEDQLKSNIQARFMKLLENDSDVEELVMGIDETASKEDREIFVKFAKSKQEGLKQELYNEFVGGGFMNKNSFLNIFEKEYNGKYIDSS